MAGRNVIQDSDDEENVEGSPPPPSLPPSAPGTSELSLSTIVDLPSSPPSRVLQKSGQPKLLNREIQDAHNNLLAPTPAGALSSTKSKRRSTQQPSVSPSVSKTKSRRATTIGSERRGKKALMTYGSKGSQDIFEFRGSSDGEQDFLLSKSSGSVARSSNTQNPQVDAERKKGTRDTAPYEKLEHDEAELDNDAEKPNLHLPNESRQYETSPTVLLHSSMLPPTLKPFVETQAQRPESSTASTVPFDTPPKLTPVEEAGSFKFSASNDRMPTPTVSSKSRSDAERPIDSSQSSAKSKTHLSTHVSVPNPSFEKRAEQKSSDSLPSRKRALTEEESGVLQLAEQHQDSQENAIQKERPTVFSSKIDALVQFLPYTADRLAIEQTLADCGGNVDLAASKLLNADEQGGGHDELSLSASVSAIGSARTRSSKSDKKRELDGKQHIDELGSDEIEIGFPKEQYQPRPSRSRSGRGEDDDLIIPVDFSKRPEASVKHKKSKRRKTTALAKATPKYEEEDEEVVTPLFSVPKSIKYIDSGFHTTPDSANVANLEIEWADPDAQDGHEITTAASLPAPKKHRGRPQKKGTEVREEISEEQPLIDDDEGEPDVEISEDLLAKEIPEPSKPSAPNRQRGRPQKKGIELREEIFEEQPLIDDEGEPDVEISEDLLAKEIPEASKPSAPKKQRGRPNKKATKSSEEVSEEQLFANDEEEPDEHLVNDLQEDQGDHEIKSPAKTPAAKKQRGRPKKKPAKAPDDIPSDDDGNEEPPEPPSTKNPRKRKKPTIEDPPIIDAADDDDPPPLPNNPPHPNPLSETQPNTTTTKNPSPPPTPSTKHPQQPETPHKPSNASQQKGPDKHSPLQSGKVRYRVGLSKRARIEPLLRVVRK